MPVAYFELILETIQKNIDMTSNVAA